MANAILPGRLGDVARAYLAAPEFGASRLATFGSVLVERICDGLLMGVLAVLSSLIVVGQAEFRELVGQALLLAIVAAAGAAAAWVMFRQGPLATTRSGSAIGERIARLVAGGRGLRSVRGAVLVAAATIVAAATTCLVSAIVTRSLGLTLSPGEVVLFTSGIALSLAVPAAPAGLGTFEFAGVFILTGLGSTPEVALAAMFLIRLVTTVPLALVGLLVTWAGHLRPRALLAAAAADPGSAANLQ